MLEGGRPWLRRVSTIVDEPNAGMTGVQLLSLSFAGLIGVGTIGLLVLPGLYTGERLGVVDALFTATSAVCVTGLTVVDTATYFTAMGQAWIALLIQLGGLGIVTLATVLLLLIGQRTGIAVSDAARSGTGQLRQLQFGRVVRSVALYTLVLETIGALVLWALWARRLGALGALWPAVFHAISAFCNAGFSVFSDSLMGWREDGATLAVIGALIVLGGLGFIVLEDLRNRVRSRAAPRLALHTVLVLAVTTLLIVGGGVLYFLFERGNTLAGLSGVGQGAGALFMSVTARTAGFNTVDYDQLANPSVFLTVVLMLIGGSPGSTAGGIKTTTVALLALSLVARLRGGRHVSLRGRTVPTETVFRSAGIAVGAVALLGVAVFVLLVTEPPAEVSDRAHFLRVVFEAHSAFGTVGLSMGSTPFLSVLGELGICLLMFLGRVGPLTIAAAMAFRGQRRHLDFRYAHEDVVVG